MQKKSSTGLIAILAAVAIAVAVFVVPRFFAGSSGEDSEEREPPASPKKVVERMLEAAQNGDVETYQNCFADSHRPKVDAASLKAANRNLTGLAFPSKTQFIDGGRRAGLVLEKVFPENNEYYRVELELIDGAWKITAMTPIGKDAPEIRYGTPVFSEVKSSRKTE